MERYIDATKIKYHKISLSSLLQPSAWAMVTYKADIDKIPTADVQEVRHGKWEETTEFNEDTIYRCSVCGEEFVTIDGTPADNLWHYCPNCGAKMDGDVK